MKSYMRKEYKLPELFEMHMGKTPDRNNSEYWENGTHPWISIADMTSNGKLITYTKEYITDKAIRETGIKPINYNTVIMSFKLSVGKVSKVATKDCPAYSNEAIMAFEIPPVQLGSPMILNDYAYYLLQSLDFTNTGNKAVMGKTLNKAILQNIAVKIHVDLDVQSEIITVLDKVTALIDKRKEQLSKLDELVKARFVELFGAPQDNPKGYKKRQLKETCKVITGNTPSRAVSEYYGEHIEWIKTDNIVSGLINPTTAVECLSEKGMAVSRTVEENSILMACIAGSVSSIGRVCINDRKVAFNQQINAIVPKDYNILFLYVLLLISKEYLVEGINMALKGILSKSKLEEKVFIVPPIELQNQFAAFVEQNDKSKLEVQKSLEKLELLKKALMQKYFG